MNEDTRFAGAARSGQYVEQEDALVEVPAKTSVTEATTPAHEKDKKLTGPVEEESSASDSSVKSGALSLYNTDELEVMQPAKEGARGFWNKATAGLLSLSPLGKSLRAGPW